MRHLVLVLLLLLSARPGGAQSAWGDLDALLLQSLSNTGQMESAFWMPDNSDPAKAQVAVGIAYIYIPGSAGNVGIGAGIFRPQGTGWAKTADITELYGQQPRNLVFGPGHVDLVTTMPGPNDPRCCPTGEAGWRIDLTTGATVRLY